MNDHTLRVLEYDRVLELIGAQARSEAGRRAVLALRPAADASPEAPARRLFQDCTALRRRGLVLPPVQFESPDEALRHAGPEGTALDAADFLMIRVLLLAADAVRTFGLGPPCEAAHALRALAGELAGCDGLRAQIDRVFDPRDGQVRDHASERLASIRAQRSTLTHRLERRMQALLNEAGLAGAFQESFVTTRHDRFVVPVRREERSRVRGILHDQSNSGETLFIEPEESVEAGNELEQLRLDERNELHRIFTGLTDQVRANAADLMRNAGLLARYDAASAVSAWALEDDCRFPALGGQLRLMAARHPLLHRHFRQEQRAGDLVPLDLDPPAGKGVLVITGSNTGGKTVVLKTVGLLTLLAQAGLPIPAAEGTSIRCFHEVMADIGDEQSIDQDLSTFSGHTRRIVEVLEAAQRADTLVLLDELGAGTDPGEGGALGCAILDVLSRCRGMALATTHLGTVKTFVFDHPVMVNASMVFNVATLRPDYRLELGRAGASYALTIAVRCGMPDDVMAAARGFIPAGEAQMEGILAQLDEKNVSLRLRLQELEAARDQALLAQAAAERDRDRLGKELADLRRERRKLLHEAQGEAAALVTDTRKQVERILTTARAQPGRDQSRELRKELDNRNAALAESREETREQPADRLGRDEVKPGARVWVAALQEHGIIKSVGDAGKRAIVDVGKLSVAVESASLCRPRGASAPSKPPPAVRWTAPRDVKTELKLVGVRVEAARSLLDQFISDAMAGGLEQVRIVHGYGTMAIAKMVHERLTELGVRSFRPGRDGEETGGSGVTIVKL
jgi:DNA mismatch repair protein MutS2